MVSLAGLGALATGAFSFGQVFAQQRPDAGQILEQQKERLQAPRPADVLPRIEDKPPPALSPPPGLKVAVKRFRITGNTIFTEAELLDAVKEFVGKELDIDGLNDAATRVRAYYRERGYFLAQAYLPRQEIRQGVVEIRVIEGRIGEIRLNLRPDTRLSERLVRGILDAHLKPGDIISETGLERPLLLINDLPNALVTSAIRPSRTVGAADVTANVSQAPGLITGSANVDNSGSRFTGEHRAGLNLNVNSPLGLGDLFSFSGYATDEKNNNFSRFAYVVPVWYYGTRLGASYTQFDYNLSKDFASLLAHGYGKVWSAYGFHPILRTRGANVIVQLAYEEKKLFDRIDSVNTLEDRIVRNNRLGAVGDFRDRALGGGLNAWSVTYTDGDLFLSPPALVTADQAAATGRKTLGSFARWNYDYRRLQRITGNANLLLSIQGQIASKNLTSAEKFSLGGPSGVRAYPVGEAVADSGNIVTGELRYLVPGFKLKGGDLTLSGFYDIGWAKLNKNPLPADTANKRSISGYGIGVSVAKSVDFVVSVNVAWRGEDERPQADSAKREPRIWVQAAKWF